MTSAMASRDRILATMRHEDVDYIPCVVDMHPGYRNGPLATAEDQFDVTDVLLDMGFDGTIDIWFPIQAPHPDVKVTYWREADPDRDGFLRGKRYDTPIGPLQQVVRETPDWDSLDHMMFSRSTRGKRDERTPDLEMLDDYNASRSVEYLVKGEDDLDKLEYLFQPLPDDALEAWREEALYAKSFAERRNLLTHGRRTFAGSSVLWLYDTADFLVEMVANPAHVERFLRIVQDWQNWALSVVLDVGVDMVSRFGLYDGPSYWGHKYFDRYLRPLIDEETRIVHDGGALHAQGQSEGITAYLDSFAAMDLDVLIGVDDIHAHDDFVELKRVVGGEVALWGGIDANATLDAGTDQDVDDAVEKACRVLGAGGGFVLWPVWSVYYQVPWSKMERLVAAWVKYRQLHR